MKRIFLNRLFLLVVGCLAFLLSGCEKETYETDIVGLWELQAIEEDGENTYLPGEIPVMLLFEKNGVYRSNQENTLNNTNNVSPYFFGAWSVTDNKWLEMGIDSWKLSLSPLSSTNLKDQWISMHLPVRFTILELTAESMVLRIKSFVGDTKYAVMFSEPNLPLITEDNYDQVSEEFKTLCTYVYRFKRR